MIKRVSKIILTLFVSAALFACSADRDLQLEVKATTGEGPAARASVMVDGVEVGLTDDSGTYSGVIRKKPGAEVQVSVIMNTPGYKVTPWKDSFVMKTPAKDTVDIYPFEAPLEATKFITFVVSEGGGPVKDAYVKIEGKQAGVTGDDGRYVYEYTSMPKKGFKMRVSKRGLSIWRRTKKVEPGQVLEITLHKEAVLIVKPLTEEYGRAKGMAGVPVRINKKGVGKTNSKGVFRYVYKGEPGKTVKVALSAPGYIPSRWSRKVKLEGRRTITRYFYPATPRPIRVGIYGYASNVPDEDISAMVDRIQEAVGNNLFSYMVFKEVQPEALKSRMKKAGVGVGKMTTKGWNNTALAGTVDAVVLGSISKGGRDYVVETKVYTSDGSLVLGQILPARDDRDMKNVAKKVVSNIIRQFPFEGLITAKEDDRYRINIGSADYKLRRGMEFALLAPTKRSDGRVMKYAEVGTFRLKKTRRDESWGEVVELRGSGKPAPGYKVVRLTSSEEEKRAAKDTFNLLAKGGVPPDVDPLGGVNVYLNDKWVGTTGTNGKAVVPVKLGKSYDLVLYRHGYQQVSEKVKAGKDGELKEFALEVNNSLLKVDSKPTGAKVFIDGEGIGTTPIRNGKQVSFGFHTLKLTVGGDYRDWEEVVEFNQKVVDHTGKNAISFFKDYLKIGNRAEQGGDIDAAIAAYSKTGMEHPDFAAAHFRLAQLYMDRKDDYASAAREFESVLSLPEIEQLVLKQYAVLYTNLGHAHYEVGNSLIRDDRGAAAQHFSNAIKNLDFAKQNTRFLPTKDYDEALHDTYYYAALSYHKLYLVTRKETILNRADLAWREYFDFFPQALEKDSSFTDIRSSAEQYWSQLKDIQ
jgi:hypothetical protein